MNTPSEETMLVRRIGKRVRHLVKLVRRCNTLERRCTEAAIRANKSASELRRRYLSCRIIGPIRGAKTAVERGSES